jgi:hypothetical protein
LSTLRNKKIKNRVENGFIKPNKIDSTNKEKNCPLEENGKNYNYSIIKAFN